MYTKEEFKEDLEAVADLAEALESACDDFLKDPLTFLKEAATELKEGAKKVAQNAQETATDLADWVQEQKYQLKKATIGVSTTEQVTHTIQNAPKKIKKTVKNAIKEGQKALEKAEKVRQYCEKEHKPVPEQIKKAMTDLTAATKKADNNNDVQKLSKSISKAWKQFVEDVKNFFRLFFKPEKITWERKAKTTDIAPKSQHPKTDKRRESLEKKYPVSKEKAVKTEKQSAKDEPSKTPRSPSKQKMDQPPMQIPQYKHEQQTAQGSADAEQEKIKLEKIKETTAKATKKKSGWFSKK